MYECKLHKILNSDIHSYFSPKASQDLKALPGISTAFTDKDKS